MRPSKAYPNGHAIVRDFPDRETLDAELRFIDRLRKYAPEDPEIYWVTPEGEHWIFDAGQIERLDVEEMQPLEAATS